MKHLSIIFIFLAGFIGFGQAQKGSETIDLGEIKVKKETVPVVKDESVSDLNRSSQSVVTFRSQTIENNSRHNVIDLTKDVSGIYFNKTGPVSFQVGSKNPSVFKIRGLGEIPNTGVLTFVDDRPQSMGIWRHPLLDTLSLDAVESVQVIKGPSGVEHGNQAVGGVIDIRTKRMRKDGIRTAIGLAYGSYNSQDYFINNRFKTGPFDYNLSVGYKSTEGGRENSDSYQQNYHMGAGYEINANWYVRANVDYADILFYNPGPTNADWGRYDAAGKTIQRDFDFRVEHEYDHIRGKVILYADTGLNKFFNDSNNIFEDYGLRIMETVQLFKGNQTKIGFDWQQFGGVYNDHPAGGHQELKKIQNDYAAYTLMDQKLDIVILSGGIRYAYNNVWDEIIIPSGGIQVNIRADQYLYGNAQRGYKTPEFGRECMAIINPPEYNVTEPEDYWQYETGLKEIHNRFFYKLSYYQITGKNLIQQVGPPPFPPSFENSGKIIINGLELEAWVKPIPAIKSGLLLGYLDPGKKTAHLALFNGKAYTIIQITSPLSMKVEAEFARDRYDSDEKKEKLDDYMVLNSSVNYDLTMSNTEWHFYLDAENILNEKYLVRSGYPAPGLILKTGVLLNI
ncbi:MAG: TonB-dependent receptor [Spirochaetes bacterium]|nr:TonB-dependent receptor [Spirochaetota bacterium]